MSTPSPDDKVYELSAQGQSAEVSFNVPQSLEGKGVVNVIRCRLPIQYSTHPGVDPMKIVQNGAVDANGNIILKGRDYSLPFHEQDITDPITEFDLLDGVTWPKNRVRSGVGVVQPYTSPGKAITNLTRAYLYTNVVATCETIKYVTSDTTFTANQDFWFEIFINISIEGYYDVSTGTQMEKLYLYKGVNRLSNWLPNDPVKKTVYVTGYLNTPGEVQVSGFNPDDAYLLVYNKSTSTVYDPPKITVDGGLKVELSGSTRPFKFDDLTKHRLNYDMTTSTEHSGRCQPYLNDCKKIVLTLTPQTQTLVTRHGGQESVFQNASISFSVFDDITGGDTDQIYSLSGDFMTNSLLKVGSGGPYAFRLQRFTVHPLKEEAQVDDIIMAPNSFTEIKYKMSPLETPKPVVQTDYPPISAPRPVPELVTQTTESSATRPYAMIGGEIPISSIEGRAAVRPRLQ